MEIDEPWDKKGRELQGRMGAGRLVKRREIKGRTNVARELDVIQSRSADPSRARQGGKKRKRYCLSLGDAFSPLRHSQPSPRISLVFYVKRKVKNGLMGSPILVASRPDPVTLPSAAVDSRRFTVSVMPGQSRCRRAVHALFNRDPSGDSSRDKQAYAISAPLAKVADLCYRVLPYWPVNGKQNFFIPHPDIG